MEGDISMTSASNATKHVVLRLVEIGDAKFVLSLRLDESLNRYLSKVEGGLDTQKEWIKAYKEREAISEEYYYVIEATDGEELGVVRLYDFRGHAFCWGSWILKSGRPKYAVIESALAVYEMAFYSLGFECSHFQVLKGNEKAISFHRRFGATQVGEDEEYVYFNLLKETYEAMRTGFREFLTGTP